MGFDLGPVDSPPCKRHLPDLNRSLRLHGVPARVLAPHVIPLSSTGNGRLQGCPRGILPASQVSITVLLAL